MRETVEKNAGYIREGWVHNLLGVILSTALITAVLISSFEIGAYSDLDFYRKEYEKYRVQDELRMEMSDLWNVTEYMMSYLRGDKEVLRIMTPIDGERQDFFNEQDRIHMKDVQGLFLGGLKLRRGSLFLAAVSVFLLGSAGVDWKRIFARMYRRVLGVFLIFTIGTGGLLMRNFEKYFLLFHRIFFDNDYWIFDPAEDYMIRMLPEGFFYDMVMRIGGIFLIHLFGILLISILLDKSRKWLPGISMAYKTI